MRQYIPSGVSHAFCNICGRSNCDGYGDGASIPDHEPDIDSVEEQGSMKITCDICGKSIYHDFKGNTEFPSWHQVTDAWENGPDEVDSNNENKGDFCAGCWALIESLFRSCHSCLNFAHRDVCSAAQCGGASNLFPGFVLNPKSCIKCANFPHLMQCHKPDQCGGAAKGFPRFVAKSEEAVPAWGNMPEPKKEG